MKGTQCANLVFVLLASLSSSRAQDFFFPGQDNGEARKAEAAPKVGGEQTGRGIPLHYLH